jgi:tetratricopeptide (TPR) repeat protein
MQNQSKAQGIAIGIFIALFALLYFGCDTKSKEHKDLEKSRADKIELIDIDRHIRKQKEQLPSDIANDIANIERRITEASAEDDKIEGYKDLASIWYSAGYPLPSAFYAEHIAKMEDTGDAWSIAGTTYSLAVKKTEDDTEKQYAISKSRSALNKAIDRDESNIDNKINLALSYVEVQDQDNPMKGILMLVDLNKKNPDNPSVLYQLGRLSLGTNQLDKAVSRLSRAVEIKKDYKAAYCLLAIAYEKSGDQQKAMEAKKYCDTIKN